MLAWANTYNRLLHGVPIAPSKVWEYNDSFNTGKFSWYNLRSFAVNGIDVDIKNLEYEFGNCRVPVYSYASHYWSILRPALAEHLKGAPTTLNKSIVPYALAKEIMSIVIHQLQTEFKT